MRVRTLSDKTLQAILFCMPILFLGVSLCVSDDGHFQMANQIDVTIRMFMDRLIVFLLLLLFLLSIFMEKNRTSWKKTRSLLVISALTFMIVLRPIILNHVDSVSYVSLSVLTAAQIGVLIMVLFVLNPKLTNCNHSNGFSFLLVFLLVGLTIMFNHSIVEISTNMLQKYVELTNGFITFRLIINLLLFLIFMACLKISGPLKSKDLGLDPSTFLRSLWACLLLWCVVQITVVVELLFTKEKLTVTFRMTEDGFPRWLGGYLGYIWGVGLFEEAVFRGFLFVQVFLFLKRKWGVYQKRCLLCAFILYQMIFGLVHVPDSIGSHFSMDRLFFRVMDVTAFGMLLTIAFIRTNHLVVPVVIHGVLDYSVPIFSGSVPVQETTYWVSSYSVMLLMVWSWFRTDRKAAGEEPVPTSHNAETF